MIERRLIAVKQRLQQELPRRGRLSRSFSFRTGLVLSGSVVGQAISFGLLPVIARLYGVETIGQVGATLAVLSILSLIAFWQYDQAIIVAKDSERTYLLLLAILLLGSLIACLAAALFLITRLAPSALVFLNRYGINYDLVVLLPPYAMFLLMTNLQLRNNHLLQVSAGRLIYYGGAAILQVFAAIIWGATTHAFLLSQATAAFLAALTLVPYASVRRGWQTLRAHSTSESVQGIREVAHTYSNFPRYQTGAEFLNAFSLSLPVLALNSGFSSTWAGWYFMANRLLAAPVVLLSQAIGQVFYRDSAERERAGVDQAQFLEKIATVLMKVGVFFGVALGTIAPFLVPIVLGEEWAPVANIMQILLLMFVVTFFTSPLTSFLNVKGRQKGALAYYSMLALVRTMAVLFAWWLSSEWLMVWAYAVASLAVMLPLFRYVIRSAGGSVRRIVANAKSLLIELACVIAVALVLSLIGWLDSWIGAAVIFGLLIAIATLQIRYAGDWRTAST